MVDSHSRIVSTLVALPGTEPPQFFASGSHDGHIKIWELHLGSGNLLINFPFFLSIYKLTLIF